MRKICILTKSLKDKGYCVVGIDTTNGEVIRLVADKDGTAIDKEVLDNRRIELFDVILVNLSLSRQVFTV
jgi:hypothetical protein